MALLLWGDVFNHNRKSWAELVSTSRRSVDASFTTLVYGDELQYHPQTQEAHLSRRNGCQSS